MPQIKQYENPVPGIRATETGVEATAQAARRGAQIFKETAGAERSLAAQTDRFGQEVQQAGRLEGHMYETAARDAATGLKDAGDAAVDYMQHREISQGSAAYAGLLEKTTNAWNDTVKNADPNDPALAEKFKQGTLEPALDTFKQSFWTEGGQKWAEARVEAMRNHFFEKTTQDMGTLAQVAVQTNMRKVANSMSNTAMNDPSSVPHLLDTIDATIDAQISTSPNLKGANAAKFKTEIAEQMKEGIVKAGAFGAIQASGDPEGSAQGWAQKYPQYINGQEEMTLAKAARTQARFNAAQDKAMQVAQKQLDAMDFEQANTKLLGSLINPDGTTRVANADDFRQLKEVAKMPGAKRASIEAMYNFMSKQERVMNSDPNVVTDLQTKVINNDPTAVMDMVKANVAKQLSDKDLTHLKELQSMVATSPIKEKGVSVALAGAKASIVVPTNYSDFVSDFLPQYLRLPPEQRVGALDFSNPKSLISTVMATHQPSQADKIQFKALQSVGMGIPNMPALTPAIGTVKDGWKFKGGNPADPNSWEKAQ